MQKPRWLSLLIAGALLFSTAVPAVQAAEEEGDSGGLAVSAPAGGEDEGSRREPPEDDEGGLAAVPPASSERKTSTKAPPADDEGGLASSTVSGRGPIINNNRGGKEDAESKSEDAEEPQEEPGEILAGVTLNTASHSAYAFGSGGAFPTFRPSDGVSRAEAAVMLFRLLPQDTVLPSNVSYSDVASDAWYAQAVKTLGALGVMRPGAAEFGPGEPVTRGEFLRYVASFFPLRKDAQQFADVPSTNEDAPYILSARAYGWVQGGADGTFKPDQSLTRAAAVSILNRALGRIPDKNYIDSKHPAFYLDVAPDNIYYYDIMEATVTHLHNGANGETWTAHTARTEVPAEGLQLVNGWLYYYDAGQEDIARSRSVGNFTFDAAGHFTSGNAELDGKLRNIVLAQTQSSMTQEEMLRALYVYTRDSFTYLRRPAYAFGAHDFMVEDALRILNTGYGNCYCYASLFWFLSRWIGYDSVIYSGTVGQNRAPHSWVEIAFDGKWYIFDTELEMAYHKKNRYDINLYKYIDVNNGWYYVRPSN